MPLTFRTVNGNNTNASYSTLLPLVASYGLDTSSSIVINYSGPYTNYNVTRSGGSNATYYGLTGTTYTDTGLSANTSYSYQIFAKNLFTTTLPTNLGTIWTMASVSLAAPTINTTDIVFTWSGSYNYITIVNNTTSVSSGNIPSGTTTYTDSGLSGGTYIYTITAYNGAGIASNVWYNTGYLTSTLPLTVITIIPYVLAFAAGSVYKSLNGSTFTPLTSNLSTILNTASALQIAYSNSVFVAVGGYNGNSVAYSTDAVTWTGAGLPFAPTTTSVSVGPAPGLQVSGNVFICTGPKTNQQGASGTAGNTTLAWSSNGITWTGITSISATAVFTGNGGGRIIYNKNLSMWIANCVNNNGNAGVIGYSTDGLNWTKLNPTEFNGYGTGLDYNPSNGLTVCCGNATYNSSTVQTIISTNGTTWTNSASPFGTNGVAYAVSYGSGTFMVAGNGSNIVYSSTNGYTWTSKLASQTSLLTDPRAISYSSSFNTWYVGGNGSRIYYSSDNGSNWNAVSLSNIYGFYSHPN